MTATLHAPIAPGTDISAAFRAAYENRYTSSDSSRGSAFWPPAAQLLGRKLSRELLHSNSI
jgi:hypothetical protein